MKVPFYISSAMGFKSPKLWGSARGLFLDPQGAVPPRGPAHKTFEAEHLLSMTKQVGMDGWLALRDVVLLRHDAARCISRGQRKGKPEDVQTTAAGLNPTQNFCLYIHLSQMHLATMSFKLCTSAGLPPHVAAMYCSSPLCKSLRHQ